MSENSMLDQDTLAEIDRISRFPFLSEVGAAYAGPHVAVKTWAAAETKQNSRRWEDYVQAGINHLSQLADAAEEKNLFSEKVRLEIRTRTQPARDRIALIVAANSKALYWPATAGNIVSYAVTEFHLRHREPPRFFWPVLLPILEQGRLPCGCNAGFLPLKTRQGDFHELPACKLFIL